MYKPAAQYRGVRRLADGYNIYRYDEVYDLNVLARIW